MVLLPLLCKLSKRPWDALAEVCYWIWGKGSSFALWATKLVMAKIFLTVQVQEMFFNLNEYCNGIYHKSIPMTMIFETTKMKRKVKWCTHNPVKFCKKGTHCHQCYRNSKEDTAEKESKYNYSKFGCPTYDEPISKECWKNGYKKHKEQDFMSNSD